MNNLMKTDLQQMTSLEIVQVTGKPHNDVLKAIRKMKEAWVKVNQGNFTFVEYRDAKGELCLCYSLTETSYKTPDGNELPLETVGNLACICNFWLEELRFTYNTLYVLEPHEDYETSKHVEGIVINQGFRSLQVCEAMEKAGLKPSKTSNHLRGCAVDIRCKDKLQADRYMQILNQMSETNNRDFDELFLERRGNTYWVHFAVRPKDNRRKILFFNEQ